MIRAVLAAAVLLGSPAASAHRFARPKADHFIVQPHRVLLLATYAISPGPAARSLRRLFDADGDGRLSRPERHRIGEYLARMATHRLELRVNGSRATLRRLGLAVRGLRGPASSHAALESRTLLEAPAVWRVGDNRIEIADRHPDRAIPVPARLHLTPPFDLRSTTLGRWEPAMRDVTDVELRDGARWQVVFHAPEVLR